MNTSAPLHTPSRISQCWLLLAVGSLGLSAMAALVLVLARTPLLTTLVAADTFPRALVVHVNLATTIWFLSMACAFWTERVYSPARQCALALALLLGLTGAAGVILSGFGATGAPVLANYVPYLDNSLFIGSLACFGTGSLATAVISLHRPRDTAEWGFAIARWPILMAALYLSTDVIRGAPLVDAVWGAGHLLQFSYVTLLMAIWLRLTERVGGNAPPRPLAVTLFFAAALPATITPVLSLSGVVQNTTLSPLHTTLMQWTNWPAPLLFGLTLIAASGFARRLGAFPASITLFATGCLAGLAIESQTTMIPAHYHGTIGAFTLVLIAATIARLSPAHRKEKYDRPSPLPLALYSFGMFLLIAGLAWSGALGAPRKTPFSGEGADFTSMLAAGLTGLGGAVTIAGVTLFAVIAVPRIYRLCNPQPLQHPAHENQASGAPTFASAQ